MLVKNETSKQNGQLKTAYKEMIEQLKLNLRYLQYLQDYNGNN